jgi:hypothetical protein
MVQRPYNPPLALPFSFYVLAILMLLTFRAAAQTPSTQTIPLSANWNLVAFQVIATNPAPSAVFGPLGGNFKAAFTCDADTNRRTSSRCVASTARGLLQNHGDSFMQQESWETSQTL